MATLTPSDRDAYTQLLSRLREAAVIAKERLPWAVELIRADLDDLRSTLVDMERGFGANLGRMPTFLDRKRFRYLDFLVPQHQIRLAETDRHQTVRARRESDWLNAA